MKLTHQRMTNRYNNTPESLTEWLVEQLECRGIDAVVYTRYILSLLQEDDTNDDEDNGFSVTTGLRKQNPLNQMSFVKENIKSVKTTNKWKHKRYLNTNNNNNGFCVNNIGGEGHDSCDCWPHSVCCCHQSMNSDEERKLAVVQCLKSASEQEIGIESFVDELCAKLKSIKLLSETNELSIDCKTEAVNNNNNGQKVSPKEQAMKYYAAFPALDTNTTAENTVHKITDDVKQTPIVKQSNKTKWNGQKIIEFISSSIGTGSNDIKVMTDGHNSQPTISAEPKQSTDEPKSVENEMIANSDANKYIYCEDIESKVLQTKDEIKTSLVVNKTPISGELAEDTDKFERLVNKFNSNIASIWSKAGLNNNNNINNSVRNDNIWSFDSSFSSTHSSATPSPKHNAIDFWSAIGITELNERLAGKRVDQIYSIPEINWESSLLKSINAFPDDGFIDGNHELIDDENNWSNIPNELTADSTTITLQNHQKNSPFIEFNSFVSSTPKGGEKEPTLSQMLSLSSLVNKSKHRLCQTPEENLLTSPKTHFQPIRRDSFDRDESDDGSLLDITDAEVKKLIICSDKCPNNANNKHKMNEENQKFGLKLRSLSTSLDEMESFMGPFTDLDYNYTELVTTLPVSEEMEFNNSLKGDQMRDKSTNTETEPQVEVKTMLEPIIESAVESEPDSTYQDLFHMINEVLRTGLSEEDSLTNGCSSLTTATDDWYDSDSPENGPDLFDSRNQEKRLSWNCYWDTYDSDSIEQMFADNETKAFKDGLIQSKSVSDILAFGHKLSEIRLDPMKESLDEVFCEDFYQNSDQNDDISDKCLDFDYCYPEAYDYDVNEVYTNYMPASELAVNQMSSYEPNFHLNLKPRHFDGFNWTRKPCTYFIEGNCKRSDCKYSHDFSAITCKYWEEGFCFKAELCPFLHGYIDDENFGKHESFSKECYAIESDADFPALALNSFSDTDNTPTESVEKESSLALEQHFFNFRHKSVAEGTGNAVAVSKAKLPIAVFMKKKVKKRKDRNLQ